MSVFESLESTNKHFSSPWKASKDLAEQKPLEGGKSYKSLVADPTTGLDLSKLPGLDRDIGKLSLTMPVASSPISVLSPCWSIGTERALIHRSR
ncbi:hypothetical protein DPMN_059902 [Dreissena polymorpha]|uniref:Uncharacterized protein n=1 Tax=Dreissena polymorpha TaxID=45954 RepID=A0A9D4HH05_DREPO|nr:hypothetical protein DPMN_059902 [Dreissena polymorpha]